MPSRARKRAVAVSRACIDEVSSFVQHGTPLTPFMAAVIVHDIDEAARLASPDVRKHDILPLLTEEVSNLIPEGMFAGDADAIERWVGHRGFEGAAENEKLMFYMMSERWSPKRQGRMHDA